MKTAAAPKPGHHLLLGPSGSGKTRLVKRWIEQWREEGCRVIAFASHTEQFREVVQPENDLRDLLHSQRTVPFRYNPMQVPKGCTESRWVLRMYQNLHVMDPYVRFGLEEEYERARKEERRPSAVNTPLGFRNPLFKQVTDPERAMDSADLMKDGRYLFEGRGDFFGKPDYRFLVFSIVSYILDHAVLNEEKQVHPLLLVFDDLSVFARPYVLPDIFETLLNEGHKYGIYGVFASQKDLLEIDGRARLSVHDATKTKR